MKKLREAFAIIGKFFLETRIGKAIFETIKLIFIISILGIVYILMLFLMCYFLGISIISAQIILFGIIIVLLFLTYYHK